MTYLTVGAVHALEVLVERNEAGEGQADQGRDGAEICRTYVWDNPYWPVFSHCGRQLKSGKIQRGKF